MATTPLIRNGVSWHFLVYIERLIELALTWQGTSHWTHHLKFSLLSRLRSTPRVKLKELRPSRLRTSTAESLESCDCQQKSPVSERPSASSLVKDGSGKKNAQGEPVIEQTASVKLLSRFEVTHRNGENQKDDLPISPDVPWERKPSEESGKRNSSLSNKCPGSLRKGAILIVARPAKKLDLAKPAQP